MKTPTGKLSLAEIIHTLRTNASVSVPLAGQALAGLSPNAAYDAAKKNKLGVPVYDVGGKRRVPSIAVLKQLGIEDDGPKAA